jgi:hypothetical protein
MPLEFEVKKRYRAKHAKDAKLGKEFLLKTLRLCSFAGENAF